MTRTITVPTHDGESEGVCVYEVRWGERYADVGGGEAADVGALYILSRPPGISTAALEEECWTDYDASVGAS